MLGSECCIPEPEAESVNVILNLGSLDFVIRLQHLIQFTIFYGKKFFPTFLDGSSLTIIGFILISKASVRILESVETSHHADNQLKSLDKKIFTFTSSVKHDMMIQDGFLCWSSSWSLSSRQVCSSSPVLSCSCLSPCSITTPSRDLGQVVLF